MSRPAMKNLKVAMPIVDGMLSHQFGQSERFAILHILDGRINTIELHAPPSPEPDGLPRWLAEFGVDLIIADTMGERALGFFTDRGIDVITGAPNLEPQRLIESYGAGILASGPHVHEQ